MSGHKDHNTYGTAKEIELLSAWQWSYYQ
jgi:hypothetical protein